MKLKNEKGFTLVEILAALTILGIVFISFMTIFPQMSNLNERTETKLQTMNIAKSELVELKKLPVILNEYEKKKGSAGVDDFEVYIMDKSDYILEVQCHNVGKQTCSGIGEKNDRKNALYRINIKIIVDGKTNSETFGYIELD